MARRDTEWSGEEPATGADAFFTDAGLPENALWGDEFEPRSEPGHSWNPGERDPFYSETTHETGVAYYDAFRVEDMVRSGEIQRDGYRPGDWINVTHEGPDGNSYSTRVRLPFDWRRHDAWSDFFQSLREFYYPVWEDDTGDERTSSGYATAG